MGRKFPALDGQYGGHLARDRRGDVRPAQVSKSRCTIVSGKCLLVRQKNCRGEVAKIRNGNIASSDDSARLAGHRPAIIIVKMLEGVVDDALGIDEGPHVPHIRLCPLVEYVNGDSAMATLTGKMNCETKANAPFSDRRVNRHRGPIVARALAPRRDGASSPPPPQA